MTFCSQGRADDLRLGRSGVHAWGLFARKPIPGNEFVIEYVGELIRRTVNDVRERADADSDYRFRVDADWVVDATRRVMPRSNPGSVKALFCFCGNCAT